MDKTDKLLVRQSKKKIKRLIEKIKSILVMKMEITYRCNYEKIIRGYYKLYINKFSNAEKMEKFTEKYKLP